MNIILFSLLQFSSVQAGICALGIYFISLDSTSPLGLRGHKATQAANAAETERNTRTACDRVVIRGVNICLFARRHNAPLALYPASSKDCGCRGGLAVTGTTGAVGAGGGGHKGTGQQKLPLHRPR